MRPQEIKITDYTYDLPDHRIAKFPLEQRDSSKLLRYKDGQIKEFVFNQLPDLLEADTLLIYNNTRVINARLLFQKDSGAQIEVFCLEPETHIQMERGQCIWTCMVGNSKKWKDEVLEIRDEYGYSLQARLLDHSGVYRKVAFTWNGDYSFWDILEQQGQLPIPPYLHRAAVDADKETYQTVYAQHEGSVAAPTAGLHFTEKVFENLRHKGITWAELTLHVGAGTFRPVKSETMAGHDMHAEFIQVSGKTIQQIAQHKNRICVGTTSLRTLETLYWFGVKILEGKAAGDILVTQWEPYELPDHYNFEQALEAIYQTIGENGMLEGKTEILIAPGYKIRSVNAIITNFHQPESTLILLVAAVVGDEWRNIYQYALDHDYRFLSYGDSSLLYVS